MAMNISEYISAKKTLISQYLDNAINEKVASIETAYQHLYTSLGETSAKGKHLRGCFFLLSYEMAGGTELADVLPMAAAIEVNGSALLVHDDIMDNDMLRRGSPSMFARYIEEGKKIRAHDPIRYGVGAGILIGDIGILFGFELLNRANVSAECRRMIFERYSQDVQTTAVGQMIDFDFSNTTSEPTEEDILKLYSMKTAQYSLVNPFLMGALAAGAHRAYCAQLTDICNDLGIIFQIRDDVMGLLGDEKVTGKAAQSDVRENKKTLIRKYLFEIAEEENKEQLDRVFGNPTISESDFTALLAFVASSKVEDRINQKLTSMASSTLTKLNALSLPKEYLQLMNELVDYSLTRSK